MKRKIKDINTIAKKGNWIKIYVKVFRAALYNPLRYGFIYILRKMSVQNLSDCSSSVLSLGSLLTSSYMIIVRYLLYNPCHRKSIIVLYKVYLYLLSMEY